MLKEHAPSDVEAREQVVEYEFREKVRKQEEVKLRLTEDIEFSMTLFNKLNKGFTNSQKVNCFMNVCLQSLMACPAFYNLLVAIAENPEFEEKLLDGGMLKKMVYVSKFFDPKHQMDKASALSNKVVDGETIFEQFLEQYNPDKEQQDACDFLCSLLDQCHEELKQFYVAPTPTPKALNQLKGDGDWNDVGGLKAKSYQENTEQIF